MRLHKLLAVVGLSTAASMSLLNAQNVPVTVTLFSDNGYALFYTDPVSGNLVRAGFRGGFFQSDWRIPDTYTFSAPLNSYLYVIAHDMGIAAYLAAKVVFPNVTVYTGVGENWEVNTLYRTDLTANSPFQPTDPVCDPNTVADWIGENNNWEQPVAGALVGRAPGDFRDPEYDLFNPARYIWKSPGGGYEWGFPLLDPNDPDSNYTGEGTALFRLQVVPEPASLLVLGAGLAGLAGLKRRKR